MIFAMLGTVFQYALSIWFGCIFLLIAWKVMSGGIVIRGLLLSSRTGKLQMHRLQLMAVSLLFGICYLYAGLRHGGGALPNIPHVVLLALLGSQGAYLTGKLRSGEVRRG